MKKILLTLWLAGLAAIPLASAALAHKDTTDSPSGGYVGILFQENVTRNVAGDRNTYKEFIRSLPSGTQVMVAYASTSSNQVRQPFTSDLGEAAENLRAPGGLTQSAPGSPFQLVKDALELFPADSERKNALIFVSDGIDYNFGFFDTAPTGNPMLRSAIREAEKRNVTVFPIYAPSPNSEKEPQAVQSHGQGSLTFLAQATGGRSFFTGDSYVSARPHLEKIREILNLR